MKLGVFGGTGNTGLAVLEMANKLGHDLTILVRDEAKIPETLRPLISKVVVGDILDKDSVRQVIQDQDAIVIAVGTRNDLSDTDVLSRGTQNIVEAMQELNISKVSVCLSGFLFFPPDKLPPQFVSLNNEHRRMLDILKASDRQWIGVCPPHIANDPGTEKYEVTEGRTAGRRISKDDLAHFLVSCLTSDDYVHKTVGLGYLPETQ